MPVLRRLLGTLRSFTRAALSRLPGALPQQQPGPRDVMVPKMHHGRCVLTTTSACGLGRRQRFPVHTLDDALLRRLDLCFRA